MKFSELIPLLASILNLLLTLFVFTRDRRATINRVYLLWGISLSVWNLGTFFMFRVQSYSEALFWAKVLQFGVIFLPISLFHLALLIARAPSRRMMPLLYALHSILALTNFSGFFVKGVTNVKYAWYSVGGPGFRFFTMIYVFLTWATMIMLIRRLRFLPPLQRQRVKSLIWACGTLIFFGNNDIMPILGIYQYPGTNISIYPLGSLAAIFYGIVAAHSVLQHQLLDIHITLGRAAAHVVRLSFVFLVCMMLLLIAQGFFPNQMPRSGFLLTLGVFMVATGIASNFFPRLFGSGSDALERRILGDQFEYHDKIQAFIQSLPWYADSKLLMDDFNDLLVKTMTVQSYAVVLLDETSRKFSIYRSYPENAARTPLDIERTSPVFQHFFTTREDCLVLNSEYAAYETTNLERMARQQLKEFDAEFCYCFFSDEDPVGLLLIGRKASGEPYTPHDQHLMRSVVKNLSLIMNQIRLKQRVLMAEEMELLGRMSRGMAHDLNNLITPIWTYMQLAREIARPEDVSSELLPTVLRNVETIQIYVKESLFYSNTLKPHFLPGRLDETVHKAIELIKPQLQEKGVTVKCGTLPPSELELDNVLIQRLISNLLGNAGDASPTGGEIEVQLAPLSQTEASRDWFRLQIIDHGAGISRENLPHVFRPYFTTKNRGSGKRGFGLGLAICRKIVLLHGGNMNITSAEKKGTTVIVDLPTRRLDSDEKQQNPMTQALAS